MDKRLIGFGTYMLGILIVCWMLLGLIDLLWTLVLWLGLGLISAINCWYATFSLGGTYAFLAIALLLAFISVGLLIFLKFRLKNDSL